MTDGEFKNIRDRLSQIRKTHYIQGGLLADMDDLIAEVERLRSIAASVDAQPASASASHPS